MKKIIIYINICIISFAIVFYMSEVLQVIGRYHLSLCFLLGIYGKKYFVNNERKINIKQKRIIYIIVIIAHILALTMFVMYFIGDNEISKQLFAYEFIVYMVLVSLYFDALSKENQVTESRDASLDKWENQSRDSHF